MAAKLVKENILVNAIAPGPYPSQMLGSAVDHDYSETARKNPRKRVGMPEDIAGLVIFLCSQACEHRNITNPAISSGMPTLFRGFFRAVSL